MDEARIRLLILEFLDDECGIDTAELTDEMPLFTSGMLTSLDAIRLLNFIELKGGVALQKNQISIGSIDSISVMAKKFSC
jgi:acyl carrier protein